MKEAIADQITTPYAVGVFEARGVELFYRRHNAKYGHLVAIFPYESWAKRLADKFNLQIDASTQGFPCQEKVVYRCVDLGGEE